MSRTLTRRHAAWISTVLVSTGLVLGTCSTDSSGEESTTTASTSSASSAESSSDASDSTDATTTEEIISSTAEAAQAFLDTLSDEARETVLYD
ncbi:hypothetical protein ACTXLS_02800 [Corynebacterium variabile]|uniref:hypothetical protein n=1 Tax=Corynebacterium variabile TaxID=1727 RepID=UPI003FD1EAC5